MAVSDGSEMWTRSKTDVEVPVTEWLGEWNVPMPQRRISRPFCSVHWRDGAAQKISPDDKIFKRETRTQYESTVTYLLERDGKIVARADQVLWKMAPQ
jgi:hypothetical protein